MCKKCGWKIEKDKSYDIKEIAELQEEKEAIKKIAECHFVGERVLTIFKGFCGTTDVVAIEESDNDSILFWMVDKSGRKDHFARGFDFKILNDIITESIVSVNEMQPEDKLSLINR